MTNSRIPGAYTATAPTRIMTRIDCRAEVAGSNRLPVLATTINEHLEAAKTAIRRGLEHAIAAGLLLLEAKELVSHGEWLAWLQANCRIGQRQAQTYMRLARNRHRLDEAVKNAVAAHLTIAAAEALVGRPRPERPRGLPGQLDLLGGPEVPRSTTGSAASPLRDRALLIADLEQALAVRESGCAACRATANTISATIAYLRERCRN